MDPLQKIIIQPAGDGAFDWGFCDLMGTMNTVLHFIVALAALIAVGIIVYAGVRMVTAPGSSSEHEEGKKILWSAIKGLVLVLAAWLIIDTIIVVLKGSSLPQVCP